MQLTWKMVESVRGRAVVDLKDKPTLYAVYEAPYGTGKVILLGDVAMSSNYEPIAQVRGTKCGLPHDQWVLLSELSVDDETGEYLNRCVCDGIARRAGSTTGKYSRDHSWGYHRG